MFIYNDVLLYSLLLLTYQIFYLKYSGKNINIILNNHKFVTFISIIADFFSVTGAQANSYWKHVDKFVQTFYCAGLV